jgi:methylmalonyl-CoA mutase
VPELKSAPSKRGGRNVMIVVGGVIPPQDFDQLRQSGADAIFPPGTVIAKAASQLIDSMMQQSSVTH